MTVEIGRVEALFRYPVKSMRGEAVERAALGWHGIEGDRRLAFQRVGERGGNPWLSAGRLPDLTRYSPIRENEDDELPSAVRTPNGDTYPIFDEALAADVAGRHGAPVEMMQLRHGIFDETNMSIISAATVDEIGRLSETAPDVRRFRPNVLVRTTGGAPFEENEWVGGAIVFGDADDAPAVAVTMRDLRCSMVNIDPEGDGRSPAVMKACVSANDNHAGVYGTVTRVGELFVGQSVMLRR